MSEELAHEIEVFKKLMDAYFVALEGLDGPTAQTEAHVISGLADLKAYVYHTVEMYDA